MKLIKIFDDFVTGFSIGPAVLVINISLILCRLAKIRVSQEEEKLKESLNKLARNFAYWLGLMLNIVLLMKMMVLLKNAPASLRNQIIYADVGMGFSILGTKFFRRR
jgi:hypothetical protein